MSEQYKGQYAPDLFNEAKKYYLLQAQELANLTDAELRDMHLMSNTQLRRFIQSQLGDAAAIGTGFKIAEKVADSSNNFLITGGDGTLDHAGTFYLKGYRLPLAGSIGYRDQTSTPPITRDGYTKTALPALTTPTGTLQNLSDVAFAGTAPIAVGKFANIIRSDDWGRSWSLHTPFGVTADQTFLGLSMADSCTGYAVGAQYTTPGVLIFKTSDGWQNLLDIRGNIPGGYQSTHFSGVSFVAASYGWIVGENGTILRTTDGGASAGNWTQQGGSGVTTTYLKDVASVDTATAWAVGAWDGTANVVNTTDGNSWSQQYTGVPQNLNSVWAVDATYVYAVGDNGTIIRTTDKGLNWSLLSTDVTTNLRGVWFKDRFSGWVVGDGGIVSDTTNGGTTWLTKVVDSSANFASVVFSDTTGFAVGNNGTIYRTLDGTAWDRYRKDYVYVDFHLAEVTADTTMGSEYLDTSLMDSTVGLPSANRLRAVADVRVSEGWPRPADYVSDGTVQHYTAPLATMSRVVGTSNIFAAAITDARTVVRTISQLDTAIGSGDFTTGVADHSITPVKMDSSADFTFASLKVLGDATVFGGLSVLGDFTASNVVLNQDRLLVKYYIQLKDTTVGTDSSMSIWGRIDQTHDLNSPAWSVYAAPTVNQPVLNVLSDGSSQAVRIVRRSNTTASLLDVTSVGTGYTLHAVSGGGILDATDTGLGATINIEKDSTKGSAIVINTMSPDPAILIYNDPVNGVSVAVDQTSGTALLLNTLDATGLSVISHGTSRDIVVSHVGVRGLALDVTSASLDGAVNVWGTAAGTTVKVRQSANAPLMSLLKDATGEGQVLKIENYGLGVGAAILNSGDSVSLEVSQTADTTNAAVNIFNGFLTDATALRVDNFGTGNALYVRQDRSDSSATVITLVNQSLGLDMSSVNWRVDRSGNFFTAGDMTTSRVAFDSTHFISDNRMWLDPGFDSSNPGVAGRVWTEMGLLRVANGGPTPPILGVQGSTGLQGPTGLPGPTGIQGLTGIQGATGAGIQGATGVAGVNGATGIQGATGAGVQGATGVRGVTGAGIQGQTGLAGPAGVTGAQGAFGTTGHTGVQGETGIAGINGVTGVAGINGTQGVTGAQGAFGTTGHTGVQGETGVAGINGINGANGVTGIQGVTGAQGSFGTTGHTGVQGDTGLPGATGVGAGAANTLPLGWPTDGTYGGIFPFTNVTWTADAVDSINDLLLAISPAPPSALAGALTGGPAVFSAILPTGLSSQWYQNGLVAGNTTTTYTVTAGYTLSSANPATSFKAGSTFGGDVGTVFHVLDGTNGSFRDMTSGTGTTGTVNISSLATYNTIWRKANASIIYTQTSEGFKRHSMKYVAGAATQQTSDSMFWYDGSNQAPTFPTSAGIVQNTLSSARYLSGVRYYSTGDTFDYTAAIAGLANRAIRPTNPVSYSLPGFTSTNIAINGAAFNYDATYVLTQTQALNASNVYSINAQATVVGTKPSGTTASSVSPSAGRLVNTYSATFSTLNNISMYDENYRFPLSTDFSSIPGSLTGNWTSSTVLSNGNGQLYNSRWTYPSINFTTGYLPTQTANYSAFSGEQQIVWAANIGNSHSSMSIVFTGINYTDIAARGTGNLNLEIILPTSTMGWGDAGRAFGDANGCQLGSSSGSTLNLTFGTHSSSDSGGVVFIRVTLRNGSAAQASAMVVTGL